MYRNKIEEDERIQENEKLTYVAKRRLMSANRHPGGKTLALHPSGQLRPGGISYADHIASKYKQNRGMSAHESIPVLKQRGMSGVVRQKSEKDQLRGRRTAQPNQR
jgi:hypothetical protein